MVKRAGKSDETKAVTPTSKAKATKISNENIKKGLAAHIKERILYGAHPISYIHGRIATNEKMHEKLLTADPKEAQERLDNAKQAREQLPAKIQETKEFFTALINALGADETKYQYYHLVQKDLKNKVEPDLLHHLLIIENTVLQNTTLGNNVEQTAETTEISFKDLEKIVDLNKLKILIGKFRDEILATTETKRLDERFHDRVDAALKKLLK